MSYTRHRLPIARLKTLLNLVQLNAGFLSGCLRKIPQSLQGISEENQFLHLGRLLYQNLYKQTRVLWCSAFTRAASARSIIPASVTARSKHYVNCPLDYDTKMRLQRAALENDVKMPVIMKAAIDQFLTGWNAFLKAFCLR
ncbi:hypothetical protein U8C40_39170 (plasmid) [Sinorhizobium medicae]|nr:hypothetical protein U8C40_39170 [Sinorhizobium medicae]